MQIIKVAVTGATGFLGKELAIRVAQEGHPRNDKEITTNVLVTAIGRNVQIGEKLALQFPDKIKFVKLDLVRDTALLDDIIAEQQFVYHCAALCSEWGRYTDFYDANVKATQNVVNACFKSKSLVRLIHISTPSIYTTGYPRLNITENDFIPKTTEQINDYSLTKYLAEGIIKQAHTNGLPVISLRPRGIFGNDDHVILPKMLEALQRRRMVNLEPDCNKISIITELTYVQNVVDAMLLASISPEHTLGQFYNITNGETVKLYDLIKKIAKNVLDMDLIITNQDRQTSKNCFEPKRISFNKVYYIGYALEWFYALMGWYSHNPMLTRYNVCVLGLSMSFDIDKARKDLGYIPRVSLQEGIDRTLSHWKEHKFLKSAL